MKTAQELTAWRIRERIVESTASAGADDQTAASVLIL
jgi:hypothetical protein